MADALTASTRLELFEQKYTRQHAEVVAGRASLRLMDEKAVALKEAIAAEDRRIKSDREASQFGRLAYADADYHADRAALLGQRDALADVELEAGKLRKALRDLTYEMKQTGAALVAEQRRVAAPLMQARVAGLIADCCADLPRLSAVLAIAGAEQPERFQHPDAALNALKRDIDRRSFGELVMQEYIKALAQLGLDPAIEH